MLACPPLGSATRFHKGWGGPETLARSGVHSDPWTGGPAPHSCRPGAFVRCPSLAFWCGPAAQARPCGRLANVLVDSDFRFTGWAQLDPGSEGPGQPLLRAKLPRLPWVARRSGLGQPVGGDPPLSLPCSLLPCSAGLFPMGGGPSSRHALPPSLGECIGVGGGLGGMRFASLGVGLHAWG